MRRNKCTEYPLPAHTHKSTKILIFTLFNPSTQKGGLHREMEFIYETIFNHIMKEWIEQDPALPEEK